ncbi:hypothetical protein HYN56_24915 [Flavobacterium crocinum]|uniref:Uncharacterized protein n=1 Tax=Flavobacterium crocinum TaxID=2183896 RepID=A0A2S1YTA0_9FLAO|nr:hypothetical protein HYN56_24915 [Flavobacterium crocinum]
MNLRVGLGLKIIINSNLPYIKKSFAYRDEAFFYVFFIFKFINNKKFTAKNAEFFFTLELYKKSKFAKLYMNSFANFVFFKSILR